MVAWGLCVANSVFAGMADWYGSLERKFWRAWDEGLNGEMIDRLKKAQVLVCDNCRRLSHVAVSKCCFSRIYWNVLFPGLAPDGNFRPKFTVYYKSLKTMNVL
jgi:hypothetical protein